MRTSFYQHNMNGTSTMMHFLSPVLLAVSMAVGGAADAAVTAEEAKQLGTSLTPWGAERLGSKDGMVPAYGNDAIKVPSAYDPRKPGLRPDPFAKEKPLFTVTSANMAQYASSLTEGMKEVFRKYPAMRMDIYPSHRTAVYPKYVMENTIKNATACKAEQGGYKLVGCYGGLPFPIPKNGLEVVWNKLVSYTAHSWGGTASSVLVDASGGVIVQAVNQLVQESPYYDPQRAGPAADDEVYWRLRTDIVDPARRAGEKFLIIDYVDVVGMGRRAWQYLPGQRRVKVAPGLAYDTPSPQAGGSAVMDEMKVFVGAPDRYDWKLVGKKETFIPYNNFRLDDPAQCSGKVLFTKSFPNPDCMRWETHRTWVVEGTLKSGFRHIYSKRTLYIDEDAPGAVMSDSHDKTGAIYRVAMSSFIPMYESQGLMTDSTIVLDLLSGTWVALSMPGEYGGWSAIAPKGPMYYTPDAVMGSGLR